jgi:hypothetical protein
MVYREQLREREERTTVATSLMIGADGHPPKYRDRRVDVDSDDTDRLPSEVDVSPAAKASMKRRAICLFCSDMRSLHRHRVTFPRISRTSSPVCRGLVTVAAPNSISRQHREPAGDGGRNERHDRNNSRRIRIHARRMTFLETRYASPAEEADVIHITETA